MIVKFDSLSEYEAIKNFVMSDINSYFNDIIFDDSIIEEINQEIKLNEYNEYKDEARELYDNPFLKGLSLKLSDRFLNKCGVDIEYCDPLSINFRDDHSFKLLQKKLFNEGIL